jgi:hypothetical protein
LFHNTSKDIGDLDIDQSTSGLNFETKIPRVDVIKNYVRILEHIYNPENYYKRVIYNGINLKTEYKHTPDFKTWLSFMRSFLRVCKIAGFNKLTGILYWKMFFIILFRNPKSLEPAINLAAMFLHFRNQKEYIVTQMMIMMQELEIEGEEAFYQRMRVPAATEILV